MDSVETLLFGFAGGSVAFITKEFVSYYLRQRLTNQTVARSICAEVLFRLYSVQDTFQLVAEDLKRFRARASSDVLTFASYNMRKPSVDPTLIVAGFQRLSTIRLYHGWRDEHEYFDAHCAQLSKLSTSTSRGVAAIELTLDELMQSARRAAGYGWGLVAELWDLLTDAVYDRTLDDPVEFLWTQYATRPAHLRLLQAYYRIPEVSRKPNDPNGLVLCSWAGSALDKACGLKEEFELTLSKNHVLPRTITVWPYYPFVIERGSCIVGLQARSGRSYRHQTTTRGDARTLGIHP